MGDFGSGGASFAAACQGSPLDARKDSDCER